MNTFVPGTDITVVFDMVEPSTLELIEPISVSYDLFDDEGVKLITAEAVSILGGEDQISITIPALNNSILGTEGARTIALYVLTPIGITTLTSTYLLTQFTFLKVPEESGMTLPQCEILSNKMSQSVLEAWRDQDGDRKQGALREAWNRLSRIPFLPWREHEDIPSTVTNQIKAGDFSLNQLTADQWRDMPMLFRNAVLRAQLIEAAVILDGDPTWDRRQDGLISKTVGESSEMFKPSKAAFSTVSPKAYREVSGYIRRRITLARA